MVSVATPVLFEVTTAATVTARVVVAATSSEEASDKALNHVRLYGVRCHLDGGSIHWGEAYLSDPEVAKTIIRLTEERTADESQPAVMIVVADEHGANQAVYLNGYMIKSADAKQGDSVEDLLLLAQNLAGALGVFVQMVSLPQQRSDWSWDDVTGCPWQQRFNY
jgi:hypothetical protein